MENNQNENLKMKIRDELIIINELDQKEKIDRKKIIKAKGYNKK